MEPDVLIAHPLKHHLYPILKNVNRKEFTLMFYTGFYMDGIFKFFEPLFPPKYKSLLSSYYIPELKKGIIVSTFKNKVKRILYRHNLVKFYREFDLELAQKLYNGSIRPKVVHTLQNYMPETQKACREMGIKYIYDVIIDSSKEVYDLISHKMYEQECSDFNIFNRSEVLQRADLENASRVFVPNERIKDDIMKNYDVKNKIINVIPYGVDLNRFDYVSPSNKNGKLILARANSVRKGGEEFLDFIKLMSRDVVEEYRFVIVGELEGGLKNKFDKLQSNLPSNITLESGPLDYMTMLKLLKEASLLIMPTYREGMSLIVLEAFATGVVLIGSKYTGVTGLVNEDTALIMNEVSSEEIFRLFNMAVNDMKLKSRISENAKQYSLNFSSDNYSKAIVEQYRDLLY